MPLTEGKMRSQVKHQPKSKRPKSPPGCGAPKKTSEIDANIIREAVFCCRCDPAWHTHYSEEAKMAIADLHREMDKLFFTMEDE